MTYAGKNTEKVFLLEMIHGSLWLFAQLCNVQTFSYTFSPIVSVVSEKHMR